MFIRKKQTKREIKELKNSDIEHVHKYQTDGTPTQQQHTAT